MAKRKAPKEYKVTCSVQECSPEERARRDREITAVLLEVKLNAMKRREELGIKEA